MRKSLIDGTKHIFGEKIASLIYGAGKGIYRSFEDFSFSVEPHINAAENRILYFGDLDYEGIRIYEKFAEKFAAAYGAQYDIRLFQCAYERMLTKADRIGIEDLPRTKEGQNRNIGSLFLGWFSQPQQTRIKAILEQDRYIPQEILNIQDMV